MKRRSDLRDKRAFSNPAAEYCAPYEPKKLFQLRKSKNRIMCKSTEVTRTMCKNVY